MRILYEYLSKSSHAVQISRTAAVVEDPDAACERRAAAGAAPTAALRLGCGFAALRDMPKSVAVKPSFPLTLTLPLGEWKELPRATCFMHVAGQIPSRG
jgi:hypothetical protein